MRILQLDLFLCVVLDGVPRQGDGSAFFIIEQAAAAVDATGFREVRVSLKHPVQMRLGGIQLPLRAFATLELLLQLPLLLQRVRRR
jgi:hypothetical protein